MQRPPELAHDRLLRGVWRDLGQPCCWVTGGFVRDRLLGRASRDLDLVLEGDLATAGGPARRLARALGTRAHVLGREPRAVWRVERADLKVELWPLGDLSLEEDARRRDFTCNALLWRLPDGPLLDLVGGADDLRALCLRAVSHDNLRADPVRLLRVARFAAQLPELELDRATRAWTAALAPELAGAPRERCGAELLALVTTRGAARGLRLLEELRLLVPAAPPGAAVGAVDDRLERAAAALSGTRRHPLPTVRREAGEAAALALLLVAWGAPGAEEVAPYAWERPLREAAARAARLLPAALEAVREPVARRRELVHDAGAAFPALLALAAAVEPAPEGDGAAWRSWARLWRRRGAELVAPSPLLGSDEVARIAGVGPGPELGRLLRTLRRAQVRGEVRTRGAARRLLLRLACGKAGERAAPLC